MDILYVDFLYVEADVNMLPIYNGGYSPKFHYAFLTCHFLLIMRDFGFMVHFSIVRGFMEEEKQKSSLSIFQLLFIIPLVAFLALQGIWAQTNKQGVRNSLHLVGLYK